MSAITKPCPECDGGNCHGRGWSHVCPQCKGAHIVPDVEATLRAELDEARAEVERLRDIIRHNAPAVVGVCSPLVDAELDKRDAEIARLRGEVERLTALYRKADDGHDENMRETARLIGEVERLTGAALPHNASTRPEFRRDDMGNGKLKVGRDDDGDMYVSLVLPGHGFLGVGFTTPGSGGGKSPRTWAALRALLDAMTADNAAEAEP